MPHRIDAIRRWLADELSYPVSSLAPASTDASFRRYFRITTDAGPLIVMDAPPEREDSGRYLRVCRRLKAAGLTVPDVLASDLEAGFVLLSDLGSEPYLARLNEATREALYADALDALFTLQARGDTEGLPAYDRELFSLELGLFRDWFLGRHLGLALGDQDDERLEGQFQVLVENALAQPRVFVHRDYHSRNLMVRPARNPGILDFQDAVLGPITYDPVSLLRDCYIAWPEQDVYRWMEGFYTRLTAEGLLVGVTLATFREWFDLMGVQRHLKAVGIFARLKHRDAKPDYLQDIPRTLDYVYAVAARYPQLAPLHDLLGRWSVRERHQATLDDVPPEMPSFSAQRR